MQTAHFSRAQRRRREPPHTQIWKFKCFALEIKDWRLSDVISWNRGVGDSIIAWFMITLQTSEVLCSVPSPLEPPDLPPHSPVLVNSADILHATKRTLQMKHTWTKSISLLLRTLNIFAMIVFLDGLAASSCSIMLRSSFPGGHFFASLRAKQTATPLVFLTAGTWSSFPAVQSAVWGRQQRQVSPRFDASLEDASAAGVVNGAMTGRSNSDLGIQINSALLLNSDSVKWWVLFSWQRASCPDNHQRTFFFIPALLSCSFCFA